jgi:hypothetical protein
MRELESAIGSVRAPVPCSPTLRTPRFPLAPPAGSRRPCQTPACSSSKARVINLPLRAADVLADAIVTFLTTVEECSSPG